jgi:hypothetical protein
MALRAAFRGLPEVAGLLRSNTFPELSLSA